MAHATRVAPQLADAFAAAFDHFDEDTSLIKRQLLKPSRRKRAAGPSRKSEGLWLLPDSV